VPSPCGTSSSRLRPGVQTVMLMSQCCSDTCAAAMYDDRGPAPSGYTCGFFATRRERQAYGCYPEGRECARLGYAFRCIDALRQHPTTAAAHRAVLVTNDSPDVPVRTSDLSRERLVSQEAAARGLANKLGILNIPIERDMAKPEVEQGRTSHGKQCTFWHTLAKAPVRRAPRGGTSTPGPLRCQGYPHMRYDTTLKALFQAPPQELLRLLVGGQAREMLTVEYPIVRLRRPDLVVRLTDGRLYHLELQSTNDPTMPWRMVDYYSLLRQHYGQAPQQQVLYVGEAPLALASHIAETTLSFHSEVIDMRPLDGAPWLASAVLEDHMLALLCRSDHPRVVVQRLLQRVGDVPRPARSDAFVALLILAELRR